MRRRLHTIALLIVLVAALSMGCPRCMAADGAPPANLHDRLIAEYMDGKWEDLEKDLAGGVKEIGAMPAAQKADVEYIRRTIAECKPPWWKLCKAGERIHFKPLVWHTTLSATYDPTGTDNMQLNYVGGVMSVIAGWKPTEMDNPAIGGKLQFTRGEHNEIAIWTTLGTSEAWNIMSPKFLVRLPEEGKLQFTRYVAFRGNMTGMYYCTPRARRLAIWTTLSGFTGEYEKLPDVMTRKVMAMFYAAEVLGHRQNYPTIKRPQEPPAEGAESKIVPELQEWISSNNLTFAEDKALREAIKTFASANANEQKFRQSGGKLVLPNGLFVNLDPAADKPLCAQRDAWVKAQYGKK